MSVVLEKEYKFYLKHLDEFTADHLNQFVLIKDKEIVGFYASYEAALTSGLKQFGNVPFFIKEVRESEEVHFFHQRISTKNG
ncbi:MAG: hypothetical protein A3D10_01420 [Omnitrophica WOR_2 bacterium RIFCSPHIGHO2_02_FULL_48_11]|nr:MAG: hypothetical protein A3D10_01420 [Omnitrophica WOR_2 bacterium RIFCSPHIGHO2_02_FULL_48_11]